MVHYREKVERDLAAREATGENLWTDEFSKEARVRLEALLRQGVLEFLEYEPEDYSGKALDLRVREAMRLDLGVVLSGDTRVTEAVRGLSNEYVPSLIELIVGEVEDEGLVQGVNEVLRQHRISVRLVNGRMVDFASEELHTEVVAPTLRLLSGRPGWEDVERAYQDALQEDDPGDAVTDAGTALQEALKVVGCGGNSLGRQLGDAKRRGLLAPHDKNLSEAIAGLIVWVSADRSETGDAHKRTKATEADAWLTIHVVGALIHRLAGGQPRGGAEGGS